LLSFDVKIIKRVKKGLEEILTLEETAKFLKIVLLGRGTSYKMARKGKAPS